MHQVARWAWKKHSILQTCLPKTVVETNLTTKNCVNDQAMKWNDSDQADPHSDELINITALNWIVETIWNRCVSNLRVFWDCTDVNGALSEVLLNTSVPFKVDRSPDKESVAVKVATRRVIEGHVMGVVGVFLLQKKLWMYFFVQKYFTSAIPCCRLGRSAFMKV